MPEFRKMMRGKDKEASSLQKGEHVGSPLPAPQGERNPQLVYKDAISLTRKVYGDLALDKMPPPLTGTVRKLLEVLKKSPAEIIKLAHAPAEDEYIPWHAVNVSIISLCVGMRLGLEDSELEDSGIAGLLHCVGRPIGVEKEMVFDALHLKTKSGYIKSVEENLSKVGINEIVKKTIITHHEAMGPNIYPFEPVEGLNTLSKILCVVDTYCTLLHHPILKRGYYPHTALMWIIEHKGKPFESEVLKALTDAVGFYPPGSWVELSTGDIARVVAVKPKYPMRPSVKVMFDSQQKPLEEPKDIELSKKTIIHIKGVIEESKISILMKNKH